MFFNLLNLIKDMLFFTGSYSNNVFPEPLSNKEEEECISKMLNGDNLANCIISLGAPDVFGATKVYHHDENLVNGANDNSYRYVGGDNTCIFNGKNVQGAYSNGTFGASNENDCK